MIQQALCWHCDYVATPEHRRGGSTGIGINSQRPLFNCTCTNITQCAAHTHVLPIPVSMYVHRDLRADGRMHLQRSDLFLCLCCSNGVVHTCRNNRYRRELSDLYRYCAQVSNYYSFVALYSEFKTYVISRGRK